MLSIRLVCWALSRQPLSADASWKQNHTHTHTPQVKQEHICIIRSAVIADCSRNQNGTHYLTTPFIIRQTARSSATRCLIS